MAPTISTDDRPAPTYREPSATPRTNHPAARRQRSIASSEPGASLVPNTIGRRLSDDVLIRHDLRPSPTTTRYKRAVPSTLVDPRTGSLRGFAACAPGLEQLARDELIALGLADLVAEPGGVGFQASAEQLATLLTGAGLLLDVWVHVARFEAHRFDQLERQTRRVPWRDLLPRGRALEITARSRKSRLYHTTAISQRLAGFIDAPSASETEQPPLHLRARLDHDVCTLSLVVTGAPLTKRGYRLETSKAPLREDLARALLRLAGWPERPGALVDPMCGSGTLLIEGALLATGRPPGLDRSFDAEALPFVGTEPFDRARETGRAATEPLTRPIAGGDRDGGAVKTALRNADRAGFSIDLEQGPLSRTSSRFSQWAVGLWVSNPPHGDRVSRGRDLRALHQTIGREYLRLPPSWRLALAVTDVRLARATGVALEPRLMTDHGGRKLYLVTSPLRR